MKKSIFILMCLCLAAVLALTSCARIKSAVGIDRMENADVAILPNNDDSNPTVNDPHADENQEISYGKTEEIEKPPEPTVQIGEPLLVDHSPKNEKGSTIFQYTVTGVQVLDDVSGIENLIIYDHIDENGIPHERKLDEFTDKNGKLKNEYVYVSVDINVKYISGFEEPRDELRYGDILYDYWPSGKREVTTEYENGLKLTDWEYFDENGNVFVYPKYIGGADSYWYEGAPKEAGHVVLKIGEEANWQVGRILEKSLVLKHGVVLKIGSEIGSDKKIELSIDLAKALQSEVAFQGRISAATTSKCS